MVQKGREAMGLGEWVYDLFLYPMEKRFLGQMRRNLLSPVRGSVLEIGAGTGGNFPYYPYAQMKELTVMDLSLGQKAMGYSFPAGFPVTWEEGDVEDLPFPENAFDCVVFTLVFCSVGDPERGLAEIRRVLTPNGRIFFVEHVRPRRQGWRRLADWVNPLWRRMAGGCNLNRETLKIIRRAGFVWEETPRVRGVFRSGRARKEGMRCEEN